MPAYPSSKAALNAITIVLAKSLADTLVKVTSVCLGWVQIDLAPGNKEHVPDAAEVIVRAATLGDTDATGTFIGAHGLVSW